MDKLIKYSEEEAKNAIEEKNFPLAIEIYKKLCIDDGFRNQNMLAKYGWALRKGGKSKEFIIICREYIKTKKINHKFLKNILCWCLYDEYIRNYTEKDIEIEEEEQKEKFEEFLKRANYIVNNTEQLPFDDYCINPYVLTIKKVIKIYNERSSTNYKEIISWLSKLNPDILSEKVFVFNDDKVKERELASIKEIYYQNMAKCYEKIKKYDKCIDICEKAFTEIKKFHYKNQIWLRARMYYCKCIIPSATQEDFENYKKLAYKEDFWFMYHKLSQICYRNGKIEDALLYGCKAVACKYEYEKMINLFQDIGLLWEAQSDYENAKIFFHASIYYRNRKYWNIPEELRYAASNYEIDPEIKVNVNKLKRIAENYIYQKEKRCFGEIKTILKHGCSGFIKQSNGEEDIYFNIRDICNKKNIKNGMRVEYIIENINGNKRAKNILIRG